MKLLSLLLTCLSALPAAMPTARLLPYQPAKPAQEAAKPVGATAGRAVCGDLLQQYATRPAGVQFIGCAPGEAGGQTVAIATYRVSGANSISAERFFHERYGMANLAFVCCGWEPAQGKTGQVASASLRRLNPNYVLLITMHSDAQAVEQAMSGSNTSAWRDRRKVKWFIVEVELVNA